MSYTSKNLRAIDDAAAAHGFSDTHESRFAAGDLRAEGTGLAYHVLRPNKRLPFAHRHDDAEEIIVVLAGGGRLKLDDEVIDVEPMDAVRVAPEVVRSYEAGPDGIELLVFGPRHDGDGELIQEDVWGAA